MGVVSTQILAALLQNHRFLSPVELNEAIREKLEASNHKLFQKREGRDASCFAVVRLFTSAHKQNRATELQVLYGLAEIGRLLFPSVSEEYMPNGILLHTSPRLKSI